MPEGIDVRLRAAGEYVADIERVLRGLPLAEILKAADALKSARCIYICGNGGSMATAIHFASDLQKQAHLRAFSLDNISKITAWGNDTSYTNIFSAQIGLIEPEDVLVAISGSGKSPNILAAAIAARDRGAKVIGLTGEGGWLAGMSDIAVRVRSTQMEHIEDAHLVVCHMITRLLTDLQCRKSTEKWRADICVDCPQSDKCNQATLDNRLRLDGDR